MEPEGDVSVGGDVTRARGAYSAPCVPWGG